MGQYCIEGSGLASGMGSEEFPLRGQVALVTGAARRIGRAIALELARAGADIGFTYRVSEVEARALEQELAGLGVRGRFGPRIGNSSGISPGNSCGCGG